MQNLIMPLQSIIIQSYFNINIVLHEQELLKASRSSCLLTCRVP